MIQCCVNNTVAKWINNYNNKVKVIKTPDNDANKERKLLRF